MAKKVRTGSKAAANDSGGPDVLPVMNIMFLLIPALLLAMEVASLAGIQVSPPRASALPGPKLTEPAAKPLSVFIGEDGFFVELGDQGHGQQAGEAKKQSAPTIPVLADGALGRRSYDFDALTALARRYKSSDPRSRRVRVSAEGRVSMQVLVNTMDALRGQGCDDTTGQDAENSACLFPYTVVAAG